MIFLVTGQQVDDDEVRDLFGQAEVSGCHATFASQPLLASSPSNGGAPGLQGCASASTAARLYSSLRYVPLGTRTGTSFPLLQLGEC